MRKIGLISLVLAAALLPSTMFAGRVNGFFATQEQDAAVDTNDACIEVFNNSFEVFGGVTGLAETGGCTVDIFYSTPEAHKASSSALKGSNTNSSSKVSQSIFTNVQIVAIDTDGAGAGTCSIAPFGTPFIASVEENVEKCKASGSLKATEGTPDVANSSSVSASCELGEAGVDLVVTSPVQVPTTPTQAQIDAVVAAFDGRKDVKIANDGKLQIKHKGVPNTGDDPCD